MKPNNMSPTISSVIFIAGLILFLPITTIHAQEQTTTELVSVSIQDQMIIFIGFSIAVGLIFIYLARDMILRKKTEYDEKNLESQKNKDYDKYHSDWNDDSEDYFGSRINNNTNTNKKLKEQLDNISSTGSIPDLYAILKIKNDATTSEIKKQYRVLAKQSHPDKNPQADAKETMMQINQAYEILSDPQQRKEYDNYFKG